MTAEMRLINHLKSLNRDNLAVLRASPASEISGALGDLGTLLPLMIALSLAHCIDLPSTLVFTGLFNVVTGMVFGIPLPVQPMKAIAAAVLSYSAQRTLPTTTTAGFFVSLTLLFLSTTNLLSLFTRYIPLQVIKGIQLGAGVRLAVTGTASLGPLRNADSLIVVGIPSFLFLLFTSRSPRFPTALYLFLAGVVLALLSTDMWEWPAIEIWKPKIRVDPTGLFDYFTFQESWGDAAAMAVAQLPLTVLNSVVAVSALAGGLYPDNQEKVPTVKSLGLSVGVMNVIGAWFGVMPVCHGSGGLAGQWRFGARSGASVMILGLMKMVLGVFFGNSLLGILEKFPRGVLGVMVLAAGLELAKAGLMGVTLTAETGRKEKEEWVVVMMTVLGLMGFRNDAAGFVMGMVTWGCYRGLDKLERRRERRVVVGDDGERRPLLR
ncbi:sulfate transporter [Podospora australis]|uniref:Sulfate transporter n=1 Tax=Podospora australis TaxID=1536484 RepID=A0AAN7AL24_9PEZI|nr:sulfate transporter [Podospora australis]